MPISAVVIKTDTTPVKKIVVEDEATDQTIKSKSDKKMECVFVKKGSKAVIKVIKTGIQDDTNIEVISGLSKGDELIIGPYTTVSKDLNSGDKIAVTKSPATKK